MQKLGVVSFSVKSESIRLCKVIGFLFLSLLALCGLAVPTARWACDLWAVSTDCKAGGTGDWEGEGAPSNFDLDIIHSAYVAMSTESDGVRIDGWFLYPNFM